MSTGRKLCALRQACPLYLSEMAPAHLRGSINICFQLATAIGILVANCLNYGESGCLQHGQHGNAVEAPKDDHQ